MKSEHMKFQRVPPHNHRRNHAEKAIGTWKDHFIAGLTNLEKTLWCRLNPQTDINLLWNSCVNPHLSSYADLFSKYDYNQHPLLPLGIKIIVHKKSTQRASWAHRGIVGWYLGPSLQYYRCHRVYCSAAGAERIIDTVKIIPHYGYAPSITAQDAVILATESLTSVL